LLLKSAVWNEAEELTPSTVNERAGFGKLKFNHLCRVLKAKIEKYKNFFISLATITYGNHFRQNQANFRLKCAGSSNYSGCDW